MLVRCCKILPTPKGILSFLEISAQSASFSAQGTERWISFLASFPEVQPILQEALETDRYARMIRFAQESLNAYAKEGEKR